MRRSPPYCSGESDSRFAVSPDAPSDALTRQKPPRARPLFTRPCRPFWDAFAERIRGQALPADFCNDVQQRAGYQTGALESREDGGHNLLPLLRRDQLSRYARAWTRGESHIARSNQPRCRFLPLAQVCPTAMLARPPHLPPTCAGESSVRIDEHESKDRVKDASPDRERIFWNPRDGCLRMLSVGPTSFPSSGTLRTSVVAGAWDRKEEPCRPNGPTEIFVQTAPREGNRRPEDRDAFHHHVAESGQRDRSPR